MIRRGAAALVLAAAVAGGTGVAAAAEADGAPTRVELNAVSAEIMGEVSRLRGLAVESKVAVELADRPAILAYVQKRLEETGELERLAPVGRLWSRIGLYSGKDLAAEIEAAYASQIGGYYDPARDTFYVASWVPLELTKTVMSHELVHALQDQHFDLESMMEPVPGDQDRELALGALVEGDAFAVMMEHSTGRGLAELGDLVALTRLSMAFGGDAAGMALPEGISDALKEIMVFPYVYGATFLQQEVGSKGWAVVNPAYADPPRTTEQILHPEKYWGERDLPRPVQLQALEKELALSGALCAEVLGQFLTYVWLHQGLPEERAAAAAAGWDGDRASIYGEPGKETVVYASVWDSSEDAKEMAAALVELLGGRGAPGAPFPTSRGPALVRISGDTVTFVLGPPGAPVASLEPRASAPSGEAR